MCKRVERICQVDPEGWYAPVIGQVLIRCKDCKYYKVYKVLDDTLPLCNRIRTSMTNAIEPDDFCSRAERKADADS